MRQLLHTIEAPSEQVTRVSDCQAMPIARDYLDDFLLDGYFLWCPMPYLKERSHFLSVLLALCTLAKSVVTHGPYLSSLVEHDDMVHSCRNHLQRWQILDKDRLLDQ